MNAWDRYMYSKTARETAAALEELRILAERTETAETLAANLRAQLDTEKERLIIILFERNNLAHECAAMTGERNIAAGHLAEAKRQLESMRTRAEAAELAFDTDRAILLNQLAESHAARRKLADQRDAMTRDRDNLIAQLAEAQAANHRIIKDDARLKTLLAQLEKAARNAVAYVGAANYAERQEEAVGWIDDAVNGITRRKSPTIGDEIREIWQRYGGNETGAALEVMEHMIAHDAPCTLEYARALLVIHVRGEAWLKEHAKLKTASTGLE